MFKIDQEKQEISRVFSSLTDVPVNVVIGANDGRFIPNINASKWKDECWLNINYPVAIGNEKLSINEDIIKQRVGDLEFMYWHVGDKVLEQGFRFYTKPPATLTLNIKDSGNLRYLYQELNPAGLESYFGAGDGDCWWPENTRGSYAIYKTGWAHNQYRTGKFCHLYRWIMIDALGKKAWTKNQTIKEVDGNNKQLIIELDPSFLNTAVYPITIMGGGDTWGLTTEGAASTYLSNESAYVGTLGALAGAGAPANITNPTCYAYLCSNRAGNEARLVIYGDDGSDDPAALVAQNGSDISVADDNCAGGTGTYSGAITCSLTAGNQYHAGFTDSYDNLEIRIFYDGDANYDMHGDDSIDYSNPPANFAISDTKAGRRASIYLDYSAAPSGMSTVIGTMNYHTRIRNVSGD